MKCKSSSLCFLSYLINSTTIYCNRNWASISGYFHDCGGKRRNCYITRLFL